MAALQLLAKISLSHEIEKYGGYAGWASLVGLAVLSVLYFAQAREVRRLRDWAGRAPERDAEIQERVAATAAQKVIPPPAAPAPRPAGAPATAAAAAAAVKTAGPA